MEEEAKKKEEREQEEKEKKKYMRQFLLFILLFLVIALAAAYLSEKVFYKEDAPSTLAYNGYYFAKLDNGLWSVGLPKFVDDMGVPYTLIVHHTPKELEYISVDGDASSFFPSNKTYLSYDPEVWGRSPSLKVALMDLSLKLAGTAKLLQGDVLFNPKIVCSENKDDVCDVVGVVNCGNESEKVISFLEAGEDSIYVYGNCITLSAKKEDFMKVSDRLLYAWFGIME